MTVAIIGGGWAGLAAAIELAHRGARVILLEAGHELGGRARSVRIDDQLLDNGQHILLGAYHTVLYLLGMIGVDPSRVFARRSLRLELHSHRRTAIRMQAPALPAPWHLLVGLLRMRGLAWGERWAALRFASHARQERVRLQTHDQALGAYLQERGQSARVIQALWEPLCLAALNTPVADASAALFVNVLCEAFFARRADSDLLLPVRDLGACLPQPAQAYLLNKGVDVRLRTRVLGLEVHDDRVSAVITSDARLAVDHVILAAAPHAAARLLAPHATLAPVAAQLDALDASPITTVYLHYPEPVTLPTEFIGVLDGSVQWLFDRGRLTGQRGLIAGVISGPGVHVGCPADQLGMQVARDIGRLFPAWPAPTRTSVIREKRATFFAAAGIDARRPSSQTPLAGLWLAGDYTRTPYPGTLEGAAWSGVECARLLLNESEQQHAALSTYA